MACVAAHFQCLASASEISVQGLYIHIPFCVKKCGYCDFYSEVASEAEAQRYLDAIERELTLRLRELDETGVFGGWSGAARVPGAGEMLQPEGGKRFAPGTVFFGGGTPTKLSADQLKRLGEILHAQLDLSQVSEWTSEINPGTLDAAKARALAEMGVNRASFGVQSFDPAWLAKLDRSHEAGKVDEALEHAANAGIARRSIDLMFALPGQTLAEWERDLEQAFACKTDHISLYALMYEDDTPLTQAMQRGEVQPTDPDIEAEFFDLTRQRCAAHGLAHYEVSNFARAGEESLHNTLYWRCGDWLGLGAGAHSATGRTRWANASDHRRFAAHLLDEGNADGVDGELQRTACFPTTLLEHNSPEDFADELLLMGLRLAAGVDAQDYRTRAGISLEDRCGPALSHLSELGLIAWDGKTLKTTDQGLLVLDNVILELTRSPLSLLA